MKENEELSKEISVLSGHNNPEQKIRYLNKIKEENSQLKKDKLSLAEQLQATVDEKAKLKQKLDQLVKQEQKTGKTSQVLVDSRSDRSDSQLIKLELEKKNLENKFLLEGVTKLNNIININGFGHNQKQSSMRPSTEIDQVIQGVQ